MIKLQWKLICKVIHWICVVFIKWLGKCLLFLKYYTNLFTHSFSFFSSIIYIGLSVLLSNIYIHVTSIHFRSLSLSCSRAKQMGSGWWGLRGKRFKFSNVYNRVASFIQMATILHLPFWISKFLFHIRNHRPQTPRPLPPIFPCTKFHSNRCYFTLDRHFEFFHRYYTVPIELIYNKEH